MRPALARVPGECSAVLQAVWPQAWLVLVERLVLPPAVSPRAWPVPRVGQVPASALRPAVWPQVWAVLLALEAQSEPQAVN